MARKMMKPNRCHIQYFLKCALALSLASEIFSLLVLFLFKAGLSTTLSSWVDVDVRPGKSPSGVVASRPVSAAVAVVASAGEAAAPDETVAS